MSETARRPSARVRLAESKAFRTILAAALSIVVAALTFVTYAESARLDELAREVPKILGGLNLKEGDPAAKELTEKGTLTFKGRLIGNEAFASTFRQLFGEDGRITRVDEGSNLLIRSQLPDWLPAPFANEPLLPLGIGLIALGIVNYSCFTGLATALLGVVAASGALAGLSALVGMGQIAVNTAAIPLLVFAFVLVMRALLLASNVAMPVFAIAGGVIREAMRLRIAVSFAAAAIIAIPLLPLWLDPSSPLRYQVQTYLSRSLDIMYVAAAILTVLFGCATVAFEIRDRQAWTTLTKPVSRISWLFGKWLGLVLLNVGIISVCSLTMLAFLAQVRARPALDGADRRAVNGEVLVARIGGFPIYELPDPAQLEARVKEKIDADPNARADIKDGRRSELEVQKSYARMLAEEFVNSQRSVGPMEERSYRFTGLSVARNSTAPLSLRYKFFSGSSDPNQVYPVLFYFGEGDDAEAAYRQFVPAQTNVISVKPSAIREDGSLVIRIANWRYNPNARPGEPQFTPGASPINFDPDGLELLYKVDDFGPNLLRAQLVNLIKLSCIAMLAVAFSSFLSFPVACLVVSTIFIAGSLAPYLATSIEEFRIRTDSTLVKDFEGLVRFIAGATELAVRSFGQAAASGPVVEGRLVSWSDVMSAFFWLGVVWSGAALVLSFFVFQRKELAIYSGQGG